MQNTSRRQLAKRLLGVPVDPVAGSVSVPSPAPLDQVFDRQLLARATFGADHNLRGELQAMGAENWLEQQLHPDSIDDSDCEQKVASVAAPASSGAAGLRMLTRALYSRRQLAWRMVHFLNNHFSTYRRRTQPISETKEDDLFYKLCFRRFSDVLRMSAASPAMIDFLDSNSNVAGSPNENYARELLELHTVSVDGGYTETDVAELARVFTGWSRVNVGPSSGFTDSYFEFLPARHDTGPKTLSLGWSTPGYSGPEGRREGWEVLGFLASRPRTAAFFCEKLCRYFVSDNPSVPLVARVRQAFTGSGGDLRVTVRSMFLAPEFVAPENVGNKTLDGFEYITNVLRRFKGDVHVPAVGDRVRKLRSQPHECHIPTGYTEDGADWRGPGQLLPRWHFAERYANDHITGTLVPWDRIFPTIPPTSAAWVDGLVGVLIDDPLPETTIWALRVFMDNRLAYVPSHPTWAQVRPHARALLTLILQLPEAQLH